MHSCTCHVGMLVLFVQMGLIKAEHGGGIAAARRGKIANVEHITRSTSLRPLKSANVHGSSQLRVHPRKKCRISLPPFDPRPRKIPEHTRRVRASAILLVRYVFYVFPCIRHGILPQRRKQFSGMQIIYAEMLYMLFYSFAHVLPRTLPFSYHLGVWRFSYTAALC